MKPLSDFCKGAGIKLVIPFSIWGDEVSRNSEIFQVYQSLDELNNASIDAFISRFGNQHPVFIDCNDSTSKKGIFTFGLRNRLNARGVKYSITNLKSNEELFSKAFSRTQPNVVVLNTGRSPELTVAIAKLKALVASNPGSNTPRRTSSSSVTKIAVRRGFGSARRGWLGFAVWPAGCWRI